jgi:hypothetical protein
MNKKLPPGASRPAPPRVDPIEHEGVRYQQDMDAQYHGGDQPGGYLVAVDPASGARLWMVKVYHIAAPTRPGLPAMGRYFRRMSLLPDGKHVEVENEVGAIYRVDLKARSSTWISGPDLQVTGRRCPGSGWAGPWQRSDKGRDCMSVPRDFWTSANRGPRLTRPQGQLRATSPLPGTERALHGVGRTWPVVSAGQRLPRRGTDAVVGKWPAVPTTTSTESSSKVYSVAGSSSSTRSVSSSAALMVASRSVEDCRRSAAWLMKASCVGPGAHERDPAWGPSVPALGAASRGPGASAVEHRHLLPGPRCGSTGPGAKQAPRPAEGMPEHSGVHTSVITTSHTPPASATGPGR